MIAAAEIGKLILNPELAGNYLSADLKEIRDKFPYCSTLHLLYLKNISINSDLDFESQLRYSAAHVMDRERMYFLVHSKKTETPTALPKEETQVKQVAEEDFKSKILSEEVKAAESQNEEIEKVELSVISENNSPVGDLVDAAPDLTAIAYNQDLIEESQTIASMETKQESIEEIIPVAETKTTDEEKLISEHISESQETQENPVDVSNLSFIEWLRYKQTGKLVNTEIKKQTSVEEEKTSETPDIQGIKPTETLTETKSKKTGLSRADVDALLNKFIAEEPRISKPQATFFNPVKSAKQSLEESAELVTETLAKIYHLQKNYSKAIQAYEQLSLVYPEKKTFFASRIEKIREEQNKEK
ncbi:MAG: hypothetical protein JNJ99_00305 [Crocinitomicaceae bacterium]|nr:hypothetical protein [Crocinitomicaceae bacterium]